MAITRASKLITLTNYNTGGTVAISTGDIINFCLVGSNDTLMNYISQSGKIIQTRFTETVAAIQILAEIDGTNSLFQYVTLPNGTLMYINNERVMYLDDQTSTLLVTYDAGAIEPVQYVSSSPSTASAFVGTTGAAAANLFSVTAQPFRTLGSTTRYINNLFIDMVTPEPVVAPPVITFTTKVKTGTGIVNTVGSGYVAPVVAITGGGGSGAAGTLTSKVVSGTVAAAGTGYVAGTSVITITGGTAATAAKYNVTHTKVVSATVAAGGTGDLGDGAGVIVQGTTGTGTKFRASVTIATNAIASVESITLAGDYTLNPTAITVEPVTYISGASSGTTLTGAQLSVLMGALTLTVNTAGDYSVIPANPVAQGSATGGGTGATITASFGLLALTITSTGSGYTSYPTFAVTDSTGVSGAITASMQVESPLTIVDGGTDINSAITLTFSATTGTLATATATVSTDTQKVTATSLTNAGSYKSGTDTYPTLAITGGAGSNILYDEKKVSFISIGVEETLATVVSAVNGL